MLRTTLKPLMMVDPLHPFAKRGNEGVLIEIAVPAPRAKHGVIEAFPSPVDYDVRPCCDFSPLASGWQFWQTRAEGHKLGPSSAWSATIRLRL